MTPARVFVPLHTVGPNAREHWARRSRRVKVERRTTSVLLRTQPRPALPCVVALTRYSPGELDDDNLRGALKAIRDSVAEWLGCDDSPRSPVTWEYAQAKGAHGVLVEVRHTEPAQGVLL